MDETLSYGLILLGRRPRVKTEIEASLQRSDHAGKELFLLWNQTGCQHHVVFKRGSRRIETLFALSTNSVIFLLLTEVMEKAY